MTKGTAMRRFMRSPRRGRRSRVGGFTLIELLVVISIMSLLIAMLMPALSHARESARRAACMSNLHQIAIGLTNYLGDNNGDLPYFIPLVDDTYDDEEQDDLLEALAKYVDNTAVFTCPDDDTGVAEALGTSYDYWPGWIMWARELFRGDSPKTVARVVTKFYEYTPGNWPVLADAEGWHPPAGVGKNASFWDGSVAPLENWQDPKWKPDQ